MNNNNTTVNRGYTGNAWQGEKYNSSMGIKEIAQNVRMALKEKYPDVKFSVVKESFSMGCSLNISLISAPFDVFEAPSPEDAKLLSNNGFRLETVEEIAKAKSDLMVRGYAQVNEYRIKDDYRFTEKAKEVLTFAVKTANAYNHDDSDAQIDYFDRNFYLHIAVGRWDKPFIKN